MDWNGSSNNGDIDHNDDNGDDDGDSNDCGDNGDNDDINAARCDWRPGDPLI